jgi:hypothetical protein
MANFGLFRGFSEKLFEGELPVNLGLIGSSDFGFDPDAQAFFDRVNIAGGTLLLNEQLAIDTLVRQMKLDGIWTKMKAIYPMVGASAAACKQNLKSASFEGSFSTGWTFASTGVTPTNAYFNTNFNPNVNFNLNSFSFGGYTSTNITGGGYYGAATTTNNLFHSFQSFVRTEAFIPVGQFITYNVGTSGNSGILGFAQINFNSLTFTVYDNEVIGQSKAATVPPSLPNFNMFIGAYNNSGSPAGYDNKTISFYYYSDGLNNGESLLFYNAVQEFQTTLSRQV